MNQAPQTLKGFRDFLPEAMMVRNYVKNVFTKTLESFGFEPLETPTLEYASTLLGKYGDEADKLVYTFMDRGGREVGMRYDLTVPVSKVLAIYRDRLPLPFKQYQLQLVWRADKPQKGRYREFLQVEADTFGASSPESDAEYIALMYQVLKNLNFQNFVVKVNNRPILFEILKQAGVEDNQNSILQSLDKYDKIGEDGVKKELINKSLPEAKISAIFDSLKTIKPDQYLDQVFTAARSLGVPENNFAFEPTLVRGLDYYTGVIFEAFVLDNNIGSVCGGGRFDNLIKSLGGPDVPATGLAFGFDRVVDCVVDLGLIPNLPKTTAKVMVSIFGPETVQSSLELTSRLRAADINTFLYPAADKLGRQFKYAGEKGIPYVAVIGPNEAASGTVTLKNMTSGEQKTVKFDEVISSL